MDLVGDRWTLLIVRDLMFRGFREFGEFLRAGEAISTNILADRLKRLVDVGLVVQSDHPTDGKKYLYRLTEKGIDLAPALVQLTLWGAKYFPDHAAPEALLGMMRTSPDRLIGEVRARVLAEQASGVRASKVFEQNEVRERRSPDSGARRRPTAKKPTRSGKVARRGEARPLR